jgi:hypothetical protein
MAEPSETTTYKLDGWWGPHGLDLTYWTNEGAEFDLNAPCGEDGWQLEFTGDDSDPRCLPITPDGLRALADLMDRLDADRSNADGDA